jgi:hypothetical protein
MSPKTRLDYEKDALEKYFPTFHFQDPFGEKSGVIGRMRSNSGQEYVLWLSLKAFPNEAPLMYIIKPDQLRTHDGHLLSELGLDSKMHLREPDAHGHPQICHYNDKYWHPDVSLYKILMKARWWIEAYEQHLRHGKSIDTYLPHMT